ncbi:MAG: membrane integrity-associated transporter subunit PqiC [Planctomycetes bacterium]|nr:membrane integrity-associated transporter subunit PqiC [Planctomycetota bacterium]
MKNTIGCFGLLPLAACLSSAPPAPPVRFFDCRPAVVTAVSASVVRVEAPAYLGSEIAVRIATRELTFDGDHRWLEEPAQVLNAALRATGAAGGQEQLLVRIDRFEFDLTGPPLARVRLVLQTTCSPMSTPTPTPTVVEVTWSAADRSPAALAAAMAEAVARAAARVAEALAG